METTPVQTNLQCRRELFDNFKYSSSCLDTAAAVSASAGGDGGGYTYMQPPMEEGLQWQKDALQTKLLSKDESCYLSSKAVESGPFKVQQKHWQELAT